MELQFLQGEVVGFLRQHQGQHFSKSEIAHAVAWNLVRTQRSNESIDTLSETILFELQKHQLRTWPNITRRELVH